MMAMCDAFLKSDQNKFKFQARRSFGPEMKPPRDCTNMHYLSRALLLAALSMANAQAPSVATPCPPSSQATPFSLAIVSSSRSDNDNLRAVPPPSRPVALALASVASAPTTTTAPQRRRDALANTSADKHIAYACTIQRDIDAWLAHEWADRCSARTSLYGGPPSLIDQSSDSFIPDVEATRADGRRCVVEVDISHGHDGAVEMFFSKVSDAALLVVTFEAARTPTDDEFCQLGGVMAIPLDVSVVQVAVDAVHAALARTCGGSASVKASEVIVSVVVAGVAAAAAVATATTLPQGWDPSATPLKKGAAVWGVSTPVRGGATADVRVTIAAANNLLVKSIEVDVQIEENDAAGTVLLLQQSALDAQICAFLTSQPPPATAALRRIRRRRLDPASTAATSSSSDFPRARAIRRLEVTDIMSTAEAAALPLAWDFRVAHSNCVFRTQSQRSCGSCWAFATAGALEKQICRTSKGLFRPLLSRQHVIDCSSGSSGCNGGSLAFAGKEMASHGVVPSTCSWYHSGCTLKPNLGKVGAPKIRAALSINHFFLSHTVPSSPPDVPLPPGPGVAVLQPPRCFLHILRVQVLHQV